MSIQEIWSRWIKGSHSNIKNRIYCAILNDESDFGVQLKDVSGVKLVGSAKERQKLARRMLLRIQSIS